MSEKQKFQEILADIRSDIEFIKNDMQPSIMSKLAERNYVADREFKDWVFDVFLDKLYETYAKTKSIIEDLGFDSPQLPIEEITSWAKVLAFADFMYPAAAYGPLSKLADSVKKYESATELELALIRQKLYESNWVQLKQLKPSDYILPIQRARFVNAREELGKAKQAVKNEQWEEVLNHLRPAIDLAIKEKFGFKRVNPMKQFLVDADRYGLPLPTYTMLYDYFDEGSQRIHSGKLNTPYECQKALEFVAGFIDQLDLIDISKEKIEEFKKECRCAE